MKKVTGWLTRPFNNLRLREKLFVMFLLGAIIPLVFFVLYSYQTIKSELSDQMYTNSVASVAQINSNLENKLDTYTKLSANLYLNNSLRAYLTNNYTEEPSLFVDAYQYINNTFSNMLTTNPDIHSMSIYINNDSLPADGIYIKRMDDAFKRSTTYRSLLNSYGNVRFVATPLLLTSLPCLR